MPCWGHPARPGPMFRFEQVPKPATSDRYVRAVKEPPLYGISTRDYDRDHRVVGWPVGTEYQYAYCSNYRPILQSCQEEPLTVAQQTPSRTMANTRHFQRGGAPIYKLYDPTPLPLVDKHFRGSHYHPDDPIGVSVPEETTKVKVTAFGPERMTVREEMQHVFTPNYRYKDWVNRPLLEIEKDMSQDSLVCRGPPAPAKAFYDFYHQVRMNRRHRERLPGEELYRSCRVLPIPINHDVPNIPPPHSFQHLGKFNNYRTSEMPPSAALAQ